MSGHHFFPLALFLSFLLLMPFSLLADEVADVSVPYTDMDGDGLNDNAPDADGDGILDVAESNFIPTPAETAPAETGLVSFDVTGTDYVADFLPNSGKFLKRNQCCRMISTNRGGFGSGDQFGPGNGIGIGAVSSGGCSGGVCH